ncbi:MAG: CheR family methyltransferase [Acidobacteriota bacterium]
MAGSRFDLRHVSFHGKPDPGPRQVARVPPASHGEPSSKGVVAAAAPTTAQGFAGWLLGAAGLNPLLYRNGSLDRRVSAAFRALNVRSAADAQDLLRRRPELLAVAVGAVLIGVTDFFRDVQVFQDMRNMVIPELARRPEPLRIWSAGCSSGSELYSVLMLMDEAGLVARCAAVGTDCRADAITDARAATYNATEMREVPAAVRDKYFEEVDGRWRVIEHLRRRTAWKIADLCAGPEEGPWDAILWRNMGIYLSPNGGEHILSELVRVLAPEGFLVLGKAERPSTRIGVGLVPVCRCIYRKRA